MKTRRQIISAAALALVAIFAVGTVQAYVLGPNNWNYLGGTPVTVNEYVNPNCADPSAPNELTACQSAMATWGGAGANFAFNYAGATGATGAGYNSMNEVCWNPGSSGGALATTYMWGFGGQMWEADVVFWDGSWTWSTATSPGYLQFDVESVGLHELGHVVGLNHSEYNWAVMWYAINYMEVQRTLSSDDIAGILAIYGAGGTPNLTVDLTPTGSTALPASGGSIPYTVSVHNNGSSTANFAAWTEYLNSSGVSQGYIVQRPSLTLAGGGTITRSLTLTIAGSVPNGSYTYYARCAATVGSPTIWAQDSFPFTKGADGLSGPWVWETGSTGWDDPVSLNAVLPAEFQVRGAYPNPFNPETTLRFDLPQTAHLSLGIYDLQGRKVADLLAGTLDAGSYQITWNAAGFPSGTYLYQLNSDLGHASGRLVLTK